MFAAVATRRNSYGLLVALGGLALAACTGDETGNGRSSTTPTVSATNPAATPTLTGPSPGSTEVQVIRSIEYGSTRTYSGTTVTLTLDLFLPPSSGTKRPLLLLLGRRNYHHPSFGQKLAAQGIAVAYVDLSEYGAPASHPDTGMLRTIRHVQDAKAAVRFFREDASTEDRYGSGPERIVLGGHSAKGAVSGMATYLSDPTKADSHFQDLLADAGGLEGAGGSPGYGSSVAGWVSLAGCMRVADLDWITSASPPMLVVYGTKDTGIPPGQRTYTMLGERALWAGAIPLYGRAKTVGLAGSHIYAIENGDHMSAIDSTNAQLISRIAEFVKSGS
jgi:hypothetical protein